MRSLFVGAFIEAGEIAAQHHEVRAHGQRQRDVVIVHDAAVGADGHIDAGLLEILVAGLGYLNDSRCLAAADALGLAGDADGTAADTDLDEVRARLVPGSGSPRGPPHCLRPP